MTEPVANPDDGPANGSAQRMGTIAGMGHGFGHLLAKLTVLGTIQLPETGKQHRFLELQVVVDRCDQRVELAIESR